MLSFGEESGGCHAQFAHQRRHCAKVGRLPRPSIHAPRSGCGLRESVALGFGTPSASGLERSP